jgi:hypothetical protein
MLFTTKRVRTSFAGGRWRSWERLPGRVERRFYLERLEDALRLAMVHVRSHSRQRQNVATVMTLASVSMILPLQNGHAAGRATSSANRESGMMLFPCSELRESGRMRGLTEQEDDCQAKPQAAGNNGRSDRAPLDLPIVFRTPGNPRRPSLIRGAGVSPVGSPDPGVHDTSWLPHDCAAVQE